MTPPLKKTTLREQAYDALREMIASYRFSSGTKINIEQLSKELGVSRTPIAQALRDLEKEGLVRHVPNRGIMMAEMTPQMALDLYEVRETLEGMAARMAAHNMSEEQLDRLRALLEEQGPIINRKDLLEYSKSDFNFHGLIYESCGNWLLRELLENIKSRSRPFLCDLSPIMSELHEDHSNIYEALTNHDPASAENHIRDHNKRMRRQIEQYQPRIENSNE